MSTTVSVVMMAIMAVVTVMAEGVSSVGSVSCSLGRHSLSEMVGFGLYTVLMNRTEQRQSWFGGLR